MNTLMNAKTAKRKRKNLTPDAPTDQQGYDNLFSAIVKNTGFSHNYYLTRAISRISEAGKSADEASEIREAISWLKCAQTLPLWVSKFEQAMKVWQLNDDLKLALIYIFNAINVNNGLNHVASAIRCLESRLVVLEKNKAAELSLFERRKQ